MHYHKCNHKLEYCEVCDVVYCIKCKREWGYRKYTFYYEPNYLPYYVYTDSGNIKATITVSSTDTHIHEGGLLCHTE